MKDDENENKKDKFKIHTLEYLPINEKKMEKFKTEMANDVKLQQLKQVVLDGWPDTRAECQEAVKPYWNYRDEIGYYDGYVTKNKRLIVPDSLRPDMLKKLHNTHMGLEKTKQRARDILFWPGIKTDITELITSWGVCNQFKNNQQREPLLQHGIPDRPWQKVGTDLFELDRQNYIVIVDYFSKFFEVAKLTSTKSTSVIKKLKEIFSRYGIPEEVMSDNFRARNSGNSQ
ncbi:uncharacterized protein K02A2.6-like [Saccostrea cucullata]|uniref:uncharacterized protein K02A2.6-like n=1 Tax=Saccostrea cuccullata TaxID=36930 RepID=UPI002ECFD9AC